MHIKDVFTEVPPHPHCEGCSQLCKKKPAYGITDYEGLDEAEILILSDSMVGRMGRYVPFTSRDMDLIEGVLVQSGATCRVEISSAVKCPSVKDADMKTADRRACEKHLEETINKVKPKLVITCGNLAMRMVIKKSGITNKRGSAFKCSSDAGHEYIMVPTYHPYAVHTEPKLHELFVQDIQLAIDKVIRGKKAEALQWTRVSKVEDLMGIDYLRTTDLDLACDTETTGLDFKKKKLNTIAFSTTEGNYAIPLEHKDTPFSEEELETVVYPWVKQVLENPRNRKIFHNASFDIKFLLSKGIHTTNVYDTKIMAHLFDEESPKSLKDLVKRFFPDGIDEL
jgi:uracil-DNA glycosylase family 4